MYLLLKFSDSVFYVQGYFLRFFYLNIDLFISDSSTTDTSIGSSLQYMSLMIYLNSS